MSGGGAAGIGFRPEIAADLLGARGEIDLLELLFESSAASSRARREAVGFARAFPVVVHGVKLSLGSADGVELDRARRLGAFAREVGALAVSEHLSFVRAAGREIGHLTALPFSREAVRVLAKNVAAARRALPDVPLLLENVAWGFRPPGDEMDEGTFHHEVVRATGCQLLLDVANLLANARNAGEDPSALLERHPLEAVGQVHVAGGAWDDSGFWLDTHGHPVPVEVFGLVARVCEVAGAVPVVLERDEDFPAFSELSREVRVARGAAASRAREERLARAGGPLPSAGPVGPTLARVEALLAGALLDEPGPSAAHREELGLDGAALGRARAILRAKRVEAALSLLPRATACAPGLAEVALQLLSALPPAVERGAVRDALHVAAALVEGSAEPRLVAAAELDRATLRAHFVPGARGLELRFGPSVSRVCAGGVEAWVVKGLGRNAEVRVLARAGGSA